MAKETPIIVPYKDNRGTVLAAGQTVCYNYSGQIAMGVIESVKQFVNPRGWPTPFRPRIKVKQTHPQQGIVSTVTDHRNLMVVNEAK